MNQFIFISFRHQNASENPLTETKRSAEKKIINSGMKYTILQASFFMEMWLRPYALHWDLITRHTPFRYPVMEATL